MTIVDMNNKTNEKNQTKTVKMFKSVDPEDIEYFPVECMLTSCTMFPCLRKICSCGQEIGYYQVYIESEIGKFLREDTREVTKSEKLEAARRRFIKENNIHRNCCQRSIMVYPFYLYNDINGKQSIIDITMEFDSTSKNKTTMSRNIFCKKLNKKSVGWCPVNPDTKFDQEAYAKKLTKIALSGVKRDKENTDQYSGILYFPANQVSRKSTSEYYLKPNYKLPFEN